MARKSGRESRVVPATSLTMARSWPAMALTRAYAPDKVELGDSFDVETTSGDIASAALIAPGATTHANASACS